MVPENLAVVLVGTAGGDHVDLIGARADIGAGVGVHDGELGHLADSGRIGAESRAGLDKEVLDVDAIQRHVGGGTAHAVDGGIAAAVLSDAGLQGDEVDGVAIENRQLLDLLL